MTALPGGSAAKLSLRYEDWWTLLRMGDLLVGRASRIRLEPPGAEGRGIEFWIDETGMRWCEQAKDAPARGSWTINRLISEDVFESVQDHLAAGHSVRFVLSTVATDLSALTERAATSETSAGFHSTLTPSQTGELASIASAWGTDPETTWRYLQRVRVEHHPSDALRRLVHLTYERLIQGDPEQAVHNLRGWLTGQLQTTLTAPLIWAHLSEAGFPRRLLAGDTGTLAALAATVERQQRRAELALPVMGMIEQPYTAQVTQQLLTGQEQVVILDGRAGSGKSTVAVEAVSELARLGWYAAVLRMSAVSVGTRTARALGRDSDLDESPAILLDGVADGSPAVLLIDQLDAVSHYSGRLPDSFHAVGELLEQARLMPALKVVLAVRTVDLQHDPRMQHLLADISRVTSVTIGDLDPDAVRKALQAAGVDTAATPEATLRLLCVPLHFAVFSRLSPEAQRIPYRTLPELYDMYTNELRQQAERQAGHLDWAGITAALVGYMSDHESLLAPEAVVDNAARQEISTLVSAGVLVRDGHRLGFFHETYFDYLFARAFVTQGRDLHDFLADSGQYLFRRAQARQVLEYLAVTDRNAFRRVAVGLMASSRIRPHLHDVVARVLSGLDACPDDLRAMEPIMFDGAGGQARLLPLLSSPAWFDAADQAGRWETWLAAEATADKTARQLITVARRRPERVTELVEPYIGTPGAWQQRLRALFQWSLSPGLVGLAVRLLERGVLDDVRDPIAVNAGFFSILYQLAQDDPAGTARIIGAYLRRQQARAAADGSNDPAESGHLPDRSVSGAQIITSVAQQAPRTFLDEVLPFLVPVMDATAMPGLGGRLRATGRWTMRHVGEPTGIAEAVFAGTEQALRSLAAEAPEEALTLARPLAATDVEDLRFLACRAFTAAGSGDEAVNWLLGDDRNLNLGWADSPRAASRELIASATRHCRVTQLGALIQHLLRVYPLHELTAERRHLRGRAQYELISAVEPSRRGSDLARRLGELERKFPSDPPAPPQPVVARRVEPPVPARASHVMTDEDWLRAIARHSSEKTTWKGDTAIGGASELAELLAQRAAEDPERFARLALRFDAQTPPAHITRVIQEVAGQIPIALLGELCQHAEDIAGTEARRSICFAISRGTGEADDALVALLRQCAVDPDPAREIARVTADPGKLFFGRDLTRAGLNSTRGAAARAIADVLFAGPQHVDLLIEPLTTLTTDPILAVRSWAAEAVRALMNHRPQPALALADTLLTESEIQLLGTPTVMSLLTSALISRPRQFAPHLLRALRGPDQVAEQAGQAWAAALLRDVLSPPLPAELAGLSAAARRGAATLLASYPIEGLPTLILLFADTDPGVRAAAANALRALPDLEPRDADPLLRAFTGSPAFTEHPDIAAAALADSTQILPDATLMACEQAATAAGPSLGDLTTHHPITADQILSILLRLYRQGDSAIRQRCLDIIDQLSEHRAFDLDKKLDEIR